MKALSALLRRSDGDDLDRTLSEVGAWSCPADIRGRWSIEEADGTSRVDARLEELRHRGEGAIADESILDLRGARLVDKDLSGLDLSGADLRGADLSRADLTGARLFRADLRGAVLFRTRLDDADLTGANLAGANLEGVSAQRAGFGRARLVGAGAIEADLQGATLSLAELAGIDLRGADLSGARAREADLRRADFTRANMRGTELNGSRIREACFDGSDLRAAHLKQLDGYKEASWIGADVREVDFAGAYMTRRFIMDQNFLEEFRSQGRLNRAVYALWWATSDCGRSMVRWSLCTVALAFAFALAFAAVAVDYGDHPTWFSPYYFSVVTLTTLGFGDVVPASIPAQIVVTAEVTIGYVMLGGLISILSNKLARRAE
jgi:uncharacterized protein YjbI with pentapeptide repeats